MKDGNIAPLVILALVVLIIALCLLSPDFAAAVYQTMVCNLGPVKCVRLVP